MSDLQHAVNRAPAKAPPAKSKRKDRPARDNSVAQEGAAHEDQDSDTATLDGLDQAGKAAPTPPSDDPADAGQPSRNVDKSAMEGDVLAAAKAAREEKKRDDRLAAIAAEKKAKADRFEKAGTDLAEALRVEYGAPTGRSGHRRKIKSANGSEALEIIKGLKPDEIAKIREDYKTRTGGTLEQHLKRGRKRSEANEAVAYLWKGMTLAERNAWDPSPEAILDNIRDASDEELKAANYDADFFDNMNKHIKNSDDKLEIMGKIRPQWAIDEVKRRFKKAEGFYWNSNQADETVRAFAKLPIDVRQDLWKNNPEMFKGMNDDQKDNMRRMQLSEKDSMNLRIWQATSGAGTWDKNLEGIVKDMGRMVTEQRTLEARLKHLKGPELEKAQKRLKEINGVASCLDYGSYFTKMMKGDIWESQHMANLRKMKASATQTAEQKVANELETGWFDNWSADQEKVENSLAEMSDLSRKKRFMARGEIDAGMKEEFDSAEREDMSVYINSDPSTQEGKDAMGRDTLERNKDRWQPKMAEMLESTLKMSKDARAEFLKSDTFKKNISNLDDREYNAFVHALTTGELDYGMTMEAAAGGNWDGTNEELMTFASANMTPAEQKLVAMGATLSLKKADKKSFTPEQQKAYALYTKVNGLINREEGYNAATDRHRELVEGATKEMGATSEERQDQAFLKTSQQKREVDIRPNVARDLVAARDNANVRTMSEEIEANRDGDMTVEEYGEVVKDDTQYVERHEELKEEVQEIKGKAVLVGTIVAGVAASLLSFGSLTGVSALAISAASGATAAGTARVVIGKTVAGDMYDTSHLGKDLSKVPQDFVANFAGGAVGNLFKPAAAVAGSADDIALATTRTFLGKMKNVPGNVMKELPNQAADNITSAIVGNIEERILSEKFYQQGTGEMFSQLATESGQQAISPQTALSTAIGAGVAGTKESFFPSTGTGSDNRIPEQQGPRQGEIGGPRQGEIGGQAAAHAEGDVCIAPAPEDLCLDAEVDVDVPHTVTPDGKIVVDVGGTSPQTPLIPMKAGKPDFDGLGSRLTEAGLKAPQVDALVTHLKLDPSLPVKFLHAVPGIGPAAIKKMVAATGVEGGGVAPQRIHGEQFTPARAEATVERVNQMSEADLAAYEIPKAVRQKILDTEINSVRDLVDIDGVGKATLKKLAAEMAPGSELTNVGGVWVSQAQMDAVGSSLRPEFQTGPLKAGLDAAGIKGAQQKALIEHMAKHGSLPQGAALTDIKGVGPATLKKFEAAGARKHTVVNDGNTAELLQSIGAELDAADGLDSSPEAIQRRVDDLALPPTITDAIGRQGSAQLDAASQQVKSGDFQGAYDKIQDMDLTTAQRNHVLGNMLKQHYGVAATANHPQFQNRYPKAISDALAHTDPMAREASIPGLIEHFNQTGQGAAVEALNRLDGKPTAQIELARDLAIYHDMLNRRAALDVQQGKSPSVRDAVSDAELVSLMDAHKALSQNLQGPDARLRKIVPQDGVTDMLSMQYRGNDVDQTMLGGFVADPANTHGMTGPEMARNTGLDYDDKTFVEDNIIDLGADGVGWRTKAKDTTMYIETPATPGMLADAKVPILPELHQRMADLGARASAEGPSSQGSDRTADLAESLFVSKAHATNDDGKIDINDPFNGNGGAGPGRRFNDALPTLNQERMMTNLHALEHGAAMHARLKDGSDFKAASYSVDGDGKGSWQANTELSQAQFDEIRDLLPLEMQQQIKQALADRAQSR